MKVELKPHSDQNVDHFQDLVQNQKSKGPSRAKSQPYTRRDGRNRFSTLAQSYSGSKISPFELQQKIIVLIKENRVQGIRLNKFIAKGFLGQDPTFYFLNLCTAALMIVT